MNPLSRAQRNISIVRLFVLTLCIGAMLTSCTFSSQGQFAQSTPTPTPPPLKTLGSFAPIHGTDFLIAAIEQPPDRHNSSSSWFSLSSPSSTGYTSGVARNYIFFDPHTATFQQLLPTNDFGIIFRIALARRSDNHEQPNPPLWFLYGVVKADTNNDGNFTGGDLFSLAVSDVGGKGYIEYVADVTDIYGYTIQDETTLFLIYLKDNIKQVATIDLQKGIVTTMNALPSFGNDVR